MLNKKIPVLLILLVFISVTLLTGCLKTKAVEQNQKEKEQQMKAENGEAENGDTDRILYKFKKGSSGYYYSSPYLKDGCIYIGTSLKLGAKGVNDNYFFKLDSKLNEIWEYPLEGTEVRGSAQTDKDGSIYFLAQEGRAGDDMTNSTLCLYSLDKDGKLKWKKEIFGKGKISAVGTYELSIGKYLYILGQKYQALNLQDGSEVWSIDKLKGNSRPLIDSFENTYIISMGTIYAVDPSGKQLWTFAPQGENFTQTSLAMTPDKANIIMLVDTYVYSIDILSGKLNWEFNTNIPGDLRLTPGIDDEGNIYIVRKNGNYPCTVSAIKADGSGFLWNAEGFGETSHTPALGDDRTLYFGSEQSILFPELKRVAGFHALDMNTGIIKWKLTLESDISCSSPVISEEGIIYFATIGGDQKMESGYVYGVKTDSKGPLKGAGSAQFCR